MNARMLQGYEGAWMDNRAHGHGTFTESSGTSYEGGGTVERVKSGRTPIYKAIYRGFTSIYKGYFTPIYRSCTLPNHFLIPDSGWFLMVLVGRTLIP